MSSLAWIPKPFLKIGPSLLYKSLSGPKWHLEHVMHIQLHILLKFNCPYDGQSIFPIDLTSVVIVSEHKNYYHCFQSLKLSELK